MQEEGERIVPAMLRIMEGGPSLWRTTREGLKRRREALHARAQKCAQDITDLAAQLREGTVQRSDVRPHEHVSCYASMQ
jgi:hypothetical protein